MLRWIILRFLLVALATADCPSYKCICTEQEIASRQEVDVQCTSRQSNLGYVPVFQKFHRTISALYLNRIELTQLRNNTFKSLRYVRELYLNDNYLTSVDSQALGRLSETIELLDLQHNRLTDISFIKTHNFPRLRQLLLRDNRLQQISIDCFDQLYSLEGLNLDDNQLSGQLTFLHQPALRALRHLNMDANRLTEIHPDDFIQLRNLKSLLVNRNRLTSVDFLASPVFKQLHGVSAADNLITHINKDLMEDKTLMRWLDFSANRIADVNFLTSCSLTNLEEIYLADNQIASIPSKAFQATDRLTIFVVKNNQLPTIPRCALQRFYSRMEIFDISFNPFECDCSLSWLREPHEISTERQSICMNKEFSSTDTFTSNHCGDGDPTCQLDCRKSYANSLLYNIFSEAKPTTAIQLQPSHSNQLRQVWALTNILTVISFIL